MTLTYKEFLEYLENNFDGYEVFMEKGHAAFIRKFET